MVGDLYSRINIIFISYFKLTIDIIKYKFLIMNIYIFLKNIVNFIDFDIFNNIFCV